MLNLYFSVACICILASLVARWLVKRYEETKHLDELGAELGCLQPPKVQNQRPLGIDRMEQIFRGDAERRLMELFTFHFRQTGNTIKHTFLSITAYATCDPENIEAIQSANFKDWGMGPRRAITLPMFGDGIFTQEGAAWKHSRDILRPQFVHKQYANLTAFKQATDDVLDVISDEAAKQNGVVDLQPLFFRLTLDTTTSFLFGESVRCLKQPQDAGEQTFAKAFDLAQEYVATRFRVADFYWLVGGTRFRQACQQVHDFADTVIKRNLSKQTQLDDVEHSYVFLQSLAQDTPDNTALRGQIVNILAAGRDTTACLLSWTFFLLVRHPISMTKLKAEITNAPVEPKSITRSDLQSMTYLQNVLKETLRLYPSVPINNRNALKTTTLPTGGGPDRKSPILIPKGTSVAYNIYAMHRRPDLYGLDAELFRPERWEAPLPMDKAPGTAKWAYLPFHGGPRTCLGMDFALTEAAYVVYRIIKSYPNLRLPEGENVEIVGTEKQKLTLVLAPAEGCKIQVT